MPLVALSLLSPNSIKGRGGVGESPEVRYMTDIVAAHRCDGRSEDLHYKVFYPIDPGFHPVVIGMTGTGFQGSADCAPNGRETYRNFDAVMREWAAHGWVAVNVEYHGWTDCAPTDPSLCMFGDLTYPGTSWGSVADSTVELNIKAAARYFLTHDPDQWGADSSLGLVAFGASSGGHNAFMLALTSTGFTGAIGWSGLPNAVRGGGLAEAGYLQYMDTSPGTDVYHFGNPYNRIGPTSPPQYAANSEGEFIDPKSAISYERLCYELRGTGCWVRIIAGGLHGKAYAHQAFSTLDPLVIPPPSGMRVLDDSIAFAELFSSRA